MRNISISPLLHQKNLPPRPKINENDIKETFLKGSGPGGQKINKTNSAVQLKHIPTGIVVKSQATRSREQNRKTARRLLAEKLDELEKGEMSRTEIKRRREAKKKDRKNRKSKAKYLKLEENSQKTQTEEGGDEEGSWEELDAEEEEFEVPYITEGALSEKCDLEPKAQTEDLHHDSSVDLAYEMSLGPLDMSCASVEQLGTQSEEGASEAGKSLQNWKDVVKEEEGVETIVGDVDNDDLERDIGHKKYKKSDSPKE